MLIIQTLFMKDRYVNDILDNGMKIISWYNPGLTSVSIAVGIKYGSVDDDPRISGCAHFLEHMLFEGTKRREAKDIYKEVNKIGGYINGFTGYEDTTLVGYSHSRYFRKLMNILSDMIKNSIISSNEVEIERNTIINEILEHQDDAFCIIENKLLEILFEDHPAKMPITGTVETVKRITRNDLLEAYKKHYTPKNSVIVIYGSIKPENALKEANNYFSDFKGGYTPINRPISRKEQKKEEIEIEIPSSKQTVIGIGFKRDEFNQTIDLYEILCLFIIDNLLSLGLYERIRRKGLCYTFDTLYYPYSSFSCIGCYVVTRPKNLSKVKKIMLNEELKRIQEGSISKSEIESIKKKLIIENELLREKTLEKAQELCNAATIFDTTPTPEYFTNYIKKIKIDDIKNVIKKYINIDKSVVVILKPCSRISE